MAYDPEIHHRRSIRVKGFDYASRNAYFVTLCVAKRHCVLGQIKDSKVVLSSFGKIVLACWNDLPNHYSHIELDEFVVMPNHVHGIIRIVGAGFKPALTGQMSRSCADAGAGFKPALTGQMPRSCADTGAGFKPALTGQMSRSCADAGAGFKPALTMHGLAEVVRAFKTFSARRINALRKTTGAAFWLRNYYEHIIRNGEDLKNVRDYIIANPVNWESDEMYDAGVRLKSAGTG